MSEGDKRGSERVPLVGRVYAEVLVPQRLHITQMSEHGMQVETDFVLHLNALYEFRLGLSEQAVVLKGRVVHARISDVDRDDVTYVSGIEFLDLSDRVADTIRAFLR
jgi:hypothetical protein